MALEDLLKLERLYVLVYSCFFLGPASVFGRCLGKANSSIRFDNLNATVKMTNIYEIYCRLHPT